jgi:hypothetical protein
MSESDPVFRRLQLAGWRQFAFIDIRFHSNLTVLTGANGVGKSTILNILAAQLGVDRPYLSVPKRDEDGGFFYWIGRLASPQWWGGILSGWSKKPKNVVGEISYSDGTVSDLKVPDSVKASYQLDFKPARRINGFAIGSHRPLPAYQPIPHLPLRGIEPEEAYASFLGEAVASYIGEHPDDIYSRKPKRSLIFEIKSALAAWAAFGEGNSVFQANLRQKKAYSGFVEALRKILPSDLGFIDLSIRPPDVVMVTKSGEFLIDAASGGIATLIELTALIYGCSIRREMYGKRFVVTIDEPENHLHPSLQRTLFIKLINAFPQVQFVVATHSPFIVSALKESNVYVLRFENIDNAIDITETSRVVSVQLDYINRAGTATEILRDVLGVQTTLPQWVEADLNRIVSKFETRQIDESTLAQLKDELKSAGLGELFPEALIGLTRATQRP